MKKYRLNVKVEPSEDGRFLATSDDLSGCLAEGDTIADALQNFEGNAKVVIGFLLEKGWPLPAELDSVQEAPTVEARMVVTVGG